MKLNELKLGEHIKYVFSDFFDTIVSRKCHPEEIKIKWASKLCDFYSLPFTSEEVYKIRSECELELCNTNIIKYSESEFKYIDLLNIFYSRIVYEYNLSLGNRSDFFRIAKELEISLEKEHQYLNNDVILFLKNCKNQGVSIHLVSDFYLDSNSIKELLDYHKISELFTSIHVSSDYMKTKRSGQLYKEIIDKYKYPARSVLMIGDNEHSDYNMAIKININAFHVYRDMSFYEKSFRASMNHRLYEREVNRLFKNNHDFAFMAIPFYIFIRKLHAFSVMNNINKLCFLAREGEFLKEIFDIYNQDKAIETIYTMASRRSTYLPSLNDLNEDTFDQLLNQYPRNNLITLLKSIGLDNIDRYSSSDKRTNFHQYHLNLKLSDDYRNLINNKIFRNDFYQKSSQERECLQSYFMDKMSNGVLYLVDVGWKGSIQNNIQKAINQPVCGIYCGLLTGTEVSENNIKHALLFREYAGRLKDPYCYNDFRAAFEVFCSASHGSVKRYLSDNNVELDNNIQEKEIYDKYIRAIQKNILLTIEKLVSLEKDFSKNISETERILGRIFRKKSLIPRRSEFEMFSKIKHYENFGSFEYTNFSNKEKNRIAYLKKLIKNPTYTVSSAFWKPLSFYNNGMTALQYPFYLYKILKKG